MHKKMDKIALPASVFFPKGNSSLGVEVLGCGCGTQWKPGWKPRVKQFDCFVLSYIADGSAWYESSSAERTFMPQGSCLVIFPGVRSFYAPVPTGPWVEYWLHFQGPVVRALEAEAILKPDMPVFLQKNGDRLLPLFQQALQTATDRSEAAQRYLSGQLLHILNEMVCNQKAASALLQGKSELETLIKQIRTKPAEAWDFRKLAKQHGVTYPHFIRQFRKSAGHTPHKFVNLERMKLACQYLAAGMPVHESCFKVGMEDPYHFSRLFKQMMGRAPKYYQRLAYTGP